MTEFKKSRKPRSTNRALPRLTVTCRILTGISLPRDGVLRKRAARLDDRVRPFGGVDVAVGIDGHAFARRALIHPVFAFERWDEPGNAILVDWADPDAITPVRVVVWTRLRVD